MTESRDASCCASLQRARPRAVPARAVARPHAATPCAGCGATRAWASTGRCGSALGAAGAAVDGARRGALAARDRLRRRAPTCVSTVDQAGDRPPAPGRRGPAAPDGDADRPLVPVLALDVVVRRRARATARCCRARRCYGAAAAMALLAPLPRRALPVRHRGRRRARHRDREPRAMMKVGIVGMPNAGKSSLFNALSRAGAEAANYPFTTIEPNVAVVPVARRAARRGRARRSARRTSSRTRSSSTTSPAWSRARTRARASATSSWPTSARPTRCCTSCARTTTRTSSTRTGRVDPAADIETIETELIFADLEQAERRHERVVREARGGDKRARSPRRRWLRERDRRRCRPAGPRARVPVPDDAPQGAAQPRRR